jgi:hypothetical protein
MVIFISNIYRQNNYDYINYPENKLAQCQICGSHDGECGVYCLLECAVGYFGRKVPTFRRNLLPPSRVLAMVPIRPK